MVETAVESYLITCARCAARWTASYQVSQVTDDAGAARVFYRDHGVPCEAPFAAGNVSCSRCGGTKVRIDPRYDEIPLAGQGDPAGSTVPAGTVPGVPGPRAAAGVLPVPRQRGVPGTWHRFKFSAVVTMNAAAGRAGRRYPNGARGLVIRVPPVRSGPPQYYPAVLFTEDGRPLAAGDRGVHVTVCVPDDDASEYFQAGQRFTLWDGTDVGHGTVACRLFFGWPELS